MDDDDPMILESAESVLVTVSDAEMHQIPTLPLPVFRTEKRKTPRSVKPPLDAVLETFRSNVEDIVLAEGVAKHDGNQTAMHGTMGSLDPGTCQEWTSNSRLDIIIEVRDKTVSRMKEKDFTTRLHSKLVDIKTNRLFTVLFPLLICIANSYRPRNLQLRLPQSPRVRNGKRKRPLKQDR